MANSQEKAGELIVDLNMPTDQLEVDSKKAQGILDRFAIKVGVVAGSVAAAGTLIGTYLFRGLMYARNAFEDTVKRMDDINDAAQRIGVSATALSELEYGAKISNVSLLNLESSLRKLSQNMDDFAGNKVNNAARAFKALDINVKNSDGTMRKSTDVLTELADKFSGMKDGAAKTSLAIDLFGESGTSMIQMLNHGSVGIEKFKKEAHELGTVIDDDASAAANQWREDTDRLNQQIDGLWRSLAQYLIPAINEAFYAAKRIAGGMHGLAMEIGGFAEMMADSITDGPTAAWDKYVKVMNIVRTANAKLFADIEKSIEASRKSNLADAPRVGLVDAPTITQEDTTKEKEKQLSIEEEFLRIMTAQSDLRNFDNDMREIEARQIADLNNARYLTIAQFAQLNQLLNEGTISSNQFKDAILGVTSTMDSEFEIAADKIISNLERIKFFFENMSDSSASQWLAMGDTMVDTLGQVFGQSKEFAIAETLINTAQAVMKTLATYGATPWGFAAAAAVAAMGAAQIAKITSTKKGSKGSGTAASATPAAGGGNAAAASGAPQTLFVQGINPNQLYSGDAVRHLAEQLLQYQRDGGRVVLAQPGGGR